MGGFPFIKALLRALYSPSPTIILISKSHPSDQSPKSSSSNYQVPHSSFLIHYHTAFKHIPKTSTNLTSHTSPPQSLHTRLQSQLPYHIHSTIPHTITRTNEGQSWTYTHYYCCSDSVYHAIAMHMLCDIVMQPINTLALYLAMSSLQRQSIWNRSCPRCYNADKPCTGWQHCN